ncbi:discoidin domain-containing receptor tyrosine kinase B-like [Anneissia japonica]|uniref:discoidin domain-containing receptor tyrosine kinase B-like n=1 Tax=Anneissia japonica TaxID=1529436 RepID=UPI001425A29B|nr:discoidin domain-containing receptor tyrosine kinase B-like [Anneissia japonica]
MSWGHYGVNNFILANINRQLPAITLSFTECLEPLGMESGDIFDEQLSESSYWIGPTDHSARRGRLNLTPLAGSYIGGWCVGNGESDLIHPWIQINLLVEHNVTGIQTQGRNDQGQWVRIYTISYIKVHEMGETYITDGYGNRKVFDGNSDKNSIRAHYFNPVIQAVIIRIRPKDWMGNVCLRTEVLGCRIGKEWVRVFKGISMTGLSIYDAWNTGAGASSYHADRFLISNKHYRNNAILNNWSSFGIKKVKLTLFSPTNEEVVSVIFNSVSATSTSWFSRDNLESSPWDDIKTATINYFSIAGHDGSVRRNFFMSNAYCGCTCDVGWLVVEAGTSCPSWEGYSTNPRILYSKAATSQSWYSGEIGLARAMTIDVTF